MAKYVNIDKIPYTRIRYEDDFDVEFSPALAFKEDIDKMPSADVRENIHGEWIEGEEFLFCGETYTAGDKCSVCGRTAMGYPWHYCPNCGADMRGESK